VGENSIRMAGDHGDKGSSRNRFMRCGSRTISLAKNSAMLRLFAPRNGRVLPDATPSRHCNGPTAELWEMSDVVVDLLEAFDASRQRAA
jgi:hypothetical protein